MKQEPERAGGPRVTMGREAGTDSGHRFAVSSLVWSRKWSMGVKERGKKLSLENSCSRKRGNNGINFNQVILHFTLSSFIEKTYKSEGQV